MPFVIRTPGSSSATLVDEADLPQTLSGQVPGTYQIGRAAIAWAGGEITISPPAGAPWIVAPMELLAESPLGEGVLVDLGQIAGDQPITEVLVASDLDGELPASAILVTGERQRTIMPRRLGPLTVTLISGNGVGADVIQVGSIEIVQGSVWVFSAVHPTGFTIAASPPQPPIPVVTDVTDTTGTLAEGTEIGAEITRWLVVPAGTGEGELTDYLETADPVVADLLSGAGYDVYRLGNEAPFTTTGHEPLVFADNFNSDSLTDLSGSVGTSGHLWAGGPAGVLFRTPASAGYGLYRPTAADGAARYSDWISTPDLADFEASLVFRTHSSGAAHSALNFRDQGAGEGLGATRLTLDVITSGTNRQVRLAQALDGVESFIATAQTFRAVNVGDAAYAIDLSCLDDEIVVSYRATLTGEPVELFRRTTSILDPGRIGISAWGVALTEIYSGSYLRYLYINEAV